MKKTIHSSVCLTRTAMLRRVLAAALVERDLVNGVSIAPDSLTIDTNDVDRFGRHIAAVAKDCGVRLREVEPTDDDLESVFRYLVYRR